jgi:hypothetical protein
MADTDTKAQLQADIARLLELIRKSNQTMEHLRQAGKREDSLAYRQERHLHRQYTAQLYLIMKEYKLSVHALED